MILFLGGWWVFASFVAAIFTPNTRLGFWGTLFASLFFSPAVGVILSAISGEKKGNSFEQHVSKRLNEINEKLEALQKP